MESKLVWQEAYNTGVDFIDREHKKLFTIVNKLLVSTEKPDGKSQWACQEGIKYFKGYAVRHFEEEEAYMRSIKYKDYTMHKRRHDNFREKTLPALERELTEKEYSYEAIRHFLGVCVGWLTGHTLSEDLAIVGRGESKWVNNLPREQEIKALEQMIIRLVRDLFKMDAQLINEHYTGEDFGDRLFYRLVYRSEKNTTRHDVVFAFEKKLLVKTAGQMLGVEFKELDDIVVNATRYIAQQFLDNVKKAFPTVDWYDVEMECLLTQGQFQEIFKKEYPQYSLLFNTEAGYFAFCFIPDSKHGDVGIPINAENAMEQIRKYLKKDSVQLFRKILVVDDSRVIRTAMKNLLEPEYDVDMVDSGMAALQHIAAERPDLILLDYEMPVCDGRQILAMIRAEKKFADIPVMFLTGRGDRESVMNVLSLNPAGYILKTMNHKDIKKNIDYFFEKGNLVKA